MKKWTSVSGSGASGLPVHMLSDLIGRIDSPDFNLELLDILRPVLPAGSFSTYRTGRRCTPRLFMSGSLDMPDTTRDCWQAYLSGPHLNDSTLTHEASTPASSFLCHVSAADMAPRHREKVYDAHGISERISVIEQLGDSSFAVNFYRHFHQAPFSERQIAGFEAVAPALLAVVKKSIELKAAVRWTGERAPEYWSGKLAQLNAGLTQREIEVCARLLTGMTYDGIACDLELGVPTVKTYRNRAFARLGINFRNELYALFFSARAGVVE